MKTKSIHFNLRIDELTLSEFNAKLTEKGYSKSFFFRQCIKSFLNRKSKSPKTIPPEVGKVFDRMWDLLSRSNQEKIMEEFNLEEIQHALR